MSDEKTYMWSISIRIYLKATTKVEWSTREYVYTYLINIV